MNSAIIWSSWLFSNCQLPDLFAEAWNLCSSVIVNCSDITSIYKNSEVLSSLFLTSRTRVDIKHDSQHSMAVLSENATGDEHKKSKITWKSLTIF